MSLINSVLGSFSPPSKFRKSFEDPHARDHELPLYNPSPPHIPPPVTSSLLWSAPKASISPATHIPDDVLTLQRRARHLEQQLKELLDAQADGLMNGLSNNGTMSDELVSNGSTTPTVSSVRSADKSVENSDDERRPLRRKLGLSTARRGIFRRIQQLASVKAEELDILDKGLRDLQFNVGKTETWMQKRARLETKINGIEGGDAGAKAHALQTEASKLEHEIKQKEEELWTLKRRQRRILDEIADTENSKEAKVSSYRSSLSMLDEEVSSFLARPPNAKHTPLSTSPFPTLPPKRRTLEMAHEYWQEEYTRLAEKCEEVDVECAALEEGSVLWNDIVKEVSNYEASLQRYMQKVGRSGTADPTRLLDQMDATITFLEEKSEYASSRSWNLLTCAIGAELEAFQQGRSLLHEALGIKRKGKEKVTSSLVEFDDFKPPSEEEMTGSAIRIERSPLKPAPVNPTLFATDDNSNDDPDPELMISHQDTDTD